MGWVLQQYTRWLGSVASQDAIAKLTHPPTVVGTYLISVKLSLPSPSSSPASSPLPSFVARGRRKYQVRLVSVEDGLDIMLPLLSSRPPDGSEAAAGQLPDVAPSTETEGGKGGVKAKAEPPPTDVNNKKTSTAAKSAGKDSTPPGVGAHDGGGATEAEPEKNDRKEREVPTSGGSFFFAVPPLPKQQASGLYCVSIGLVFVCPPIPPGKTTRGSF